MTLKTKLTTAIATGAVLLNALAPMALASTTIEISGNGAGSDNWATMNQVTTQTVTQNNVANVTNNVDANASTGGNDANLNTGGTVIIDTGDAKSKVNVTNDLNKNLAEVDCCQAGDTNVTVSGNGADSDNGVKLEQTTRATVTQNNNATVNNDVDADAKTGYNDAIANTGSDVIISTGNAESDVNVSTTANVNSAKVGNNGAGASNPSATFVISGNGAGSDNYITAALTKVNAVSQKNSANVINDVDADASTGGNDANLNTGGDVIIATGKAKVMADVENTVNFNSADIDCGCTWDVKAKIAGNGAEDPKNEENSDEEENLITVDLASTQTIGQGNGSFLNNDLEDLNAKTGKNDVESNTGSVEGGDPAILTGDATVDSSVSNSGNVNVVGDFLPIELPEVPNFEFSFNFAALWAFFNLG